MSPLVREFVEVETGKGSDALDRRPQLKAALGLATATGHLSFLAARLSRDVHFISVQISHLYRAFLKSLMNWWRALRPLPARLQMTDAFVETTVLTNYLLKKDGSELAARAAIAKYSAAVVHQFAWKEFKRGPLKNFVWAFNKLSDTKSFLDSLAALQRMSLSPHKYITATAIQALHTAFSGMFAGATLADLQKRYGTKADPDAAHADALRLEIKRAIVTSWNQRHALFGGQQAKLSCYPDADVVEKGVRLEVDPRDCPRGTDCCLKAQLVQRRKDVGLAKDSLPSDDRKETRERYRVLRQIEKHPNTLMSPQDCRRFGDAYFVLFCPAGAEILTTNVRDIEGMANALGVVFTKP